MHIASEPTGSPTDQAAWAAIVRVRSAIERRERVIQAMHDYMRDQRGPNGLLPFGIHAACYRHESIRSDATLALLSSERSISDGARAMINQAASILRELGQVDLSIWVNAHINNDKETQ